jgi:hypothetical protein
MKTKMYGLTLAMAVVMLINVSVGVVQAGPCELPDFSSASFDTPTDIDNPYWPLVPGTTFVYKPVPNEENVVNTIEVTYDTKTIMGVECIVVYDTEHVEGELTEETYDWYAQDDEGNIWYFGEATESLQDDGSWSKEGSWEAGVDGALPGYVMLAKPRPGVCYQQEYLEDEAEDTAKVLRLNAKVTLENGDSYKDCLVTKEWTKLDRGVVEHKYYAPNVGLVLINELKEKTVRVELVE